MKTLDMSSKSPDQSYGTFISTMWTTIEATTAVICACLPMLRVPISRILPRVLPSSRRGQSASHKETKEDEEVAKKKNGVAKLVEFAKGLARPWLKRKQTDNN